MPAMPATSRRTWRPVPLVPRSSRRSARCARRWPQADLKEAAPARLRSRIEAALPLPPARRRRAAQILSAVPANVLRRLCGRHGAVRRPSPRARPHRRSQRSGADDRRRGRVGAYTLAAARAPDGRGNQRPAHGQAVVQRQARRRAAGHRSDRAGLHAARRPARLHRRRTGGLDRVSAPQTRHQSVRRPAIGQPRTPASKTETIQGYNVRHWSRRRSRLLGRQRSRRRTNSTSSCQKSRPRCSPAAAFLTGLRRRYRLNQGQDQVAWAACSRRRHKRKPIGASNV